MQSISVTESREIVESLLVKLKNDLKKGKIKVEFFLLELNESNYEKCNCAYVQTKDKKMAVLYEAVLNRYFVVKEEKGSPVIASLQGQISSIIPKKVKNKLFWVCGNKKDTDLDLSDFAYSFSLTKPAN